MAFEQFLLSEKIELLSMIYTPKMEKMKRNLAISSSMQKKS